MGSGEDLYESCMHLSEECTKKGGVMSIYTTSKIYYVITDPDDALKASNAAIDKHYFFDFLKPWLGNGLITASGSIWKQHRKLLNPAFRSQVLNGYIETFNSQARKFVQKLSDKEGKGLFDISSDLYESFIETVILTFFGIKASDNGNFLKVYMPASHELFGIVTRRLQNVWLQNEFIFKLLGWKKRQDEIINTLKQMSETIIQKTKIDRNLKNVSSTQTKDKEHKNLIDFLLQFYKEELYNVQEIRYQEVLGGSDRDLNKDDFNKLVYTEAVIKESLRVFCIGPSVIRNVDTDIKLKNCTLKAANYCLLFYFGINRHSVWGPDANEFRPERWLDTASLPENHNAFSTFGIGKRTCLGKTFALMSMYPVLGHLLRRYRVTADWTNLKHKVDFLLKPSSGHFISLEPRVH